MFNISPWTEVLKILLMRLILLNAWCMFIVVYVFTFHVFNRACYFIVLVFLLIQVIYMLYLSPTRTTLFCCWHVLWIDWLELIIWWMEFLWKSRMELLPCLMLRDQIHFCHWLVMVLSHDHLSHGNPLLISFIHYR